MAREILFRAKHIHVRPENEHLDGRWVYGYLSSDHHINSPELEGELLIDPETVCQYTGLKDKNGQKIFEGDIVGYIDVYSTESGYAESGCVGEVVWDKEEVCFHVTERLASQSWEVLQDCKVIGNIYDNPELLKADANDGKERLWKITTLILPLVSTQSGLLYSSGDISDILF